MLGCKLVGSAVNKCKRGHFKCKYLTGDVRQYAEAKVKSVRGEGQLFIIPVL